MICWVGMPTMTSISCLITAVCSWIMARCKGLQGEQGWPLAQLYASLGLPCHLPAPSVPKTALMTNKASSLSP